jgi:hypothetical protein
VLSVGTTAAGVCDARPLIMKSLAVGSCVVNGLAVGCNVINIVDKFRNKEEITALDVFQLASTVLFFTHSVISAKDAMSLVNTVEKNRSRASSLVLRDLMKRIREPMMHMFCGIYTFVMQPEVKKAIKIISVSIGVVKILKEFTSIHEINISLPL